MIHHHHHIMSQKQIIQILCHNNCSLKDFIEILSLNDIHIVIYKERKLNSIERLIKNFINENFLFIIEDEILNFCKNHEYESEYLKTFLIRLLIYNNEKICMDISNYIVNNNDNIFIQSIIKEIHHNTHVSIVTIPSIKHKVIKKLKSGLT